MLCLSGFDLYSRWVPLFYALIEYSRIKNVTEDRFMLLSGDALEKDLFTMHLAILIATTCS